MSGARLKKTGGVFAGIRGGFFRAENDADAGRSFAAVERHYSDRLLKVLMIISTVMSQRNKDLDEEPIEPEVLDPSEEEVAEISPPPKASHRAAPEDHRATDVTAVVPVTALQQYLAEVRRYPYLSKEEELSLFHEYRTHGDRDAAVKLIMANLRVSISIAPSISIPVPTTWTSFKKATSD